MQVFYVAAVSVVWCLLRQKLNLLRFDNTICLVHIFAVCSCSFFFTANSPENKAGVPRAVTQILRENYDDDDSSDYWSNDDWI